MNVLFLAFFWAFFGCGNASSEWSDVFKDNLKTGVYTSGQTRARWEHWIDNDFLIMNCTDELENRLETDHPMEEQKIVAGFKLDQRRCDIIFPASDQKTLKDIFQLLSGFTNAGFFEKSKGTCSVLYEVTIQLRRPPHFSFFIRRDFHGQIMFFFVVDPATSTKPEALSYIPDIVPKIDAQVSSEVSAQGAKVSAFMQVT